MYDCISPCDRALKTALNTLVKEAGTATDILCNLHNNESSERTKKISDRALAVRAAIDSRRIKEACNLLPALLEEITNGTFRASWYDAYETLQGKLLVCAALHSLADVITKRMDTINNRVWKDYQPDQETDERCGDETDA